MTFCPKTDIFNYHSYEELSKLEGKALKLTKRGISSIIPRIYDPTGLLQPFILKGKLILQQTWVYRSKEGECLGWDSKLPEEIKNRWLKWLSEIKEAAKFQVNRYIFKELKTIPSRSELTLHGFCDAGETAWGIAIYIRFYNPTTKSYQSCLIYSATRVAPTKGKLSIPRKELNAIVLVCEKLLYIAESLGIPINNISAHTDSLVSIHWISKNKNNLKLYVSNRVEKIQNSKIQIYFVPGKQNPADLVSKPKPSKEYINDTFWTSGPTFLQQDNNNWLEKYKMEVMIQDNLPDTEVNEYQTEFRKIPEANIFNSKITPETPSGVFGIMYRYNNYYTILNIVAQCFRAIHMMSENNKSENRKMQIRQGYHLDRISSKETDSMTLEEQKRMYITPSSKEIRFARNFLIKETQKLTYPEEYQALQTNQKISEKSDLIKLNPRLEEGLIVMQGRLGNLHQMPEQMKHPIILPKDSRITELIILQHHQATAHSGPELTLRNVRLQFWITGGKGKSGMLLNYVNTIM